MTDIVERLRTIEISWSDEGELAAEAADVIESLQKQLVDECAIHHGNEQVLQHELAASQANDLFAMRLLAESQAREKVLRSALMVAGHALAHPDDGWKREVDLRAQKAVREALALGDKS